MDILLGGLFSDSCVGRNSGEPGTDKGELGTGEGELDTGELGAGSTCVIVA